MLAQKRFLSKEDIQHFLDEVGQLYTTNDYPADLVYNMDETMVQINDQKSVKVIIPARDRRPAVSSPKKFEHITLMVCISAAGQHTSHVLIIKQKTQPELPQSVIDNCALVHQAAGWISKEIFEDWVVKIFIPHVKSTRSKLGLGARRAILFLDKHSSRDSESARKLFAENNIDLKLLPAHSSTILQPLDLFPFEHFKNYISSTINSQSEAAKSTVTKYELLQVAMDGLEVALVPPYCRKGFEKSGLYPFNPNMPFSSPFLLDELPNDEHQRVGAKRHHRLTEGLLLPNKQQQITTPRKFKIKAIMGQEKSEIVHLVRVREA